MPAAWPARDYDVIVIGSGSGGSVAALRLTEKGYRAAALEAGRPLEDADFPRTSWDARRSLRAPKLGCRGVVRNPAMTPADEVMKQVAGQMGIGHTFVMAPVGVFFGRDGRKEPGVEAGDRTSAVSARAGAAAPKPGNA